MPVGIGNVKGKSTDYARDAIAMATSGILTYGMLGEVGGLISFFVAPSIAGSERGKEFTQMLALLMTVDRFFERMSPRGVI